MSKVIRSLYMLYVCFFILLFENTNYRSETESLHFRFYSIVPIDIESNFSKTNKQKQKQKEQNALLIYSPHLLGTTALLFIYL